MNSHIALEYILNNKIFDTVLDVGSGAGQQAKIFKERGKNVTCVDLGTSVYFAKNDTPTIINNFNDFPETHQYDLVWCSHILEHQLNVNNFLKKVYNLTKDNGYICITVPPLKHSIVGGHVTLWNMGLLLYNMILAGIDCSLCNAKQYGYNISVIVQKQCFIDIHQLNLSFDNGDIQKIEKYFPMPVKQGFNGDIKEINWI